MREDSYIPLSHLSRQLHPLHGQDTLLQIISQERQQRGGRLCLIFEAGAKLYYRQNVY